MTIVHLVTLWGTACYRWPGRQTSNIKSIFKDPQVGFWVVSDCLFVVPVVGLWRTTPDTSQGVCARSEVLMKSKVSDFRSITATLPSVPCLQPETPTAVHDCLDVSTFSYGANWQSSAHTNRAETAMSLCLLKDFFALDRGNKTWLWRPRKIFWLVLVLLAPIPLFLGLWLSVHLITCFVTERWKVGLGNTFHIRKFTIEMLSRALSGIRCSIKM